MNYLVCLLVLLLPPVALAGDSGVACIHSASKSGMKGVAVGKAGMAAIPNTPTYLYLPQSMDVDSSAGVNQWRSVTSSALTFLQNTTSKQPQYTSYNGCAVAGFDGSSKYLQVSVTYTATSGWLVGGFRLVGPGSLGGAFLASTRIETTNTYSVVYLTYNGTDPGSAGYSRLQAGAGSYGYDTTSDFDVSDVSYAVSWGSSGSSNGTFCRVDGVSQAQSKSGTDSGQWFNNVAPNVNRLSVGVNERSSGLSSYHNGHIAGFALWTNSVPADAHKFQWEQLFAAAMGKQIYP